MIRLIDMDSGKLLGLVKYGEVAEWCKKTGYMVEYHTRGKSGIRYYVFSI